MNDKEYLIVKDRVFKNTEGNQIELVALIDKGRCDNRHIKGEICTECMIRCGHYLKINGKLQDKLYSHFEILSMQQPNSHIEKASAMLNYLKEAKVGNYHITIQQYKLIKTWWWELHNHIGCEFTFSDDFSTIRKISKQQI